jgi:hypothetical protein
MTPAQLGFRMPAEWEPHEATWIAWPHNKEDWPGRFTPIPWVYCEIIRKLAEVEKVRVLVQDGNSVKSAQRMRRKPSQRRILPDSHEPRLDARLRPDLSKKRDGRNRHHELDFQCLGQIRRLDAR